MPTGYTSKALATWAKRAQTFADGAPPDDLPTITPPVKGNAKRDVFIYMIFWRQAVGAGRCDGAD